MSGETRGLFEIWEIIVSVLLFLVVSSVILILSNPQNLKAEVISYEMSHTSSVIQKGMSIKVDYSKDLSGFSTKIENNQFQIILDKDKKGTKTSTKSIFKKNIIGSGVSTNDKEDDIFILTMN